MAHRFICVMCFILKNSLCSLSVEQMHTICFTEYVLSVYCVNVQYVMTRKIDCRKVLYCDTNEISTKHLFMNIYPKSGAFFELKLDDKMRISDLARCASMQRIPLHL